MNKIEELNVRNLKYLVKTYDSLTDVMKKTKQRLATINPDSVERYDSGKMKLTTQDDLKGFHNHREKLKRRIVKELLHYPLYTEWLSNISGIGPAIAANLILLYYYKFQTICECGAEINFQNEEIKKKKKCLECKAPVNQGLMKYKIMKKDFANISKWWSYMGQGCDEEGKKAHRVKGKSTGYSDVGRTIAWMISEQIVKQKNSKYREFYDYRKQKREITHSNTTKGHRHNMAKHEATKIFLAHLWLVARTLDGKPMTKPYKEKWYLTEPFYFDMSRMIAISR